MSATPQDVQAKLAQAVADLEKTTVGYINKNWKTPPAGSQWANGLALIAAAATEAGQLVTPAPPPPPPAPARFAWDATSAMLDPTSATVCPTFAAACGLPGFFSATDAVAYALPSDPAYAVQASATSGQQAFAGKLVNIPAGTVPGESNDKHLTVIDQMADTETDLGAAAFSNGVWSCYSGAVSPIGAVQETSPGDANAAAVALQGGLVTPSDIASGFINHALVVSCGGLGPAPCPYPARTDVGYTGPTKITLGSWLRANPAATIPATLSAFERMLATAAQQFGIFPRDTSGSTAIFAVHGLDTINQQPCLAAYSGAGVALAGTPPSVSLSATFGTWLAANLQLLQPPAAT